MLWMITNFVIDRNVSPFLSIRDFVQFRKTCKLLYNDEEAWQDRTRNLPIYVPNAKHRLGLNYLLKWSTTWEDFPGSLQWYQRIVNWLEYRISIRLMFSFIRTQNVEFFKNMDWSNLSPKQQFHWQLLFHRNRRLFKSSILDYDGRPRKRLRSGVPHRRIAQSCF